MSEKGDLRRVVSDKISHRGAELQRTVLDRIYRIARIEYEGMNDRSEAPHALVHGEALRNHIKALEKLHGLGTTSLVPIRDSFFKPLLSDL